MRTSATLPTDYGRTLPQHYRIAAAMRNTDQWVHVGDYSNRKSARTMASNIRNGRYGAYANRRYEAEAITTKDGVHQVWGRYAGERSTR